MSYVGGCWCLLAVVGASSIFNFFDIWARLRLHRIRLHNACNPLNLFLEMLLFRRETQYSSASPPILTSGQCAYGAGNGTFHNEIPEIRSTLRWLMAGWFPWKLARSIPPSEIIHPPQLLTSLFEVVFQLLQIDCKAFNWLSVCLYLQHRVIMGDQKHSQDEESEALLLEAIYSPPTHRTFACAKQCNRCLVILLLVSLLLNIILTVKLLAEFNAPPQNRDRSPYG